MIFPLNEDITKVSLRLKEILDNIHVSGPISIDDLETLAFIKLFFHSQFEEIESQLIYSMGLFHKTGTPTSMCELAYDIHKQLIHEKYREFFTPVQDNEYSNILNNSVFTFSAPTSTGKSYLFRYLLKNIDYDVLIILPSRALIAEYIYTIRQIVGDDVLVLQFIENINISYTKRRIFIVTPERAEELFAQINQFNIQLILFDEAQIVEEDIRGMRFDVIVRKCHRLLPNAKKIFAHPFVSNPEIQISRNQLGENSCSKVYKQQSVGKLFVTRENGKYSIFSPFTSTYQLPLKGDIVYDALNGNSCTILIYVSKAILYNEEFMDKFRPYIELCTDIENTEAKNIINELQEYLGGTYRGEDKSLLLSLMQKGIVIHHGSMPLKARLLIERFVNKGYARICFATSTLIQGINMPFDIVWIDNFRFNGNEHKKNLDLKNLIGRAGRTTNQIGKFDYGFVIVNDSNKKTFIKQMQKDVVLSDVSKLDGDIENIDEDLQDIYEAIKNDSYDDQLHITNLQKDRLLARNVFEDIKIALDLLFVNGNIISADDYSNIRESDKRTLKEAIRNIYLKHLRRDSLEIGEKSILSTSIPIILWRIHGKSFREIVALRKSYVTNKSKKNKIKKQYKEGKITQNKMREKIAAISLKFTPEAAPLPDRKVGKSNLFSDQQFKYDRLVYDTYDYLDKVINLSLSAPICAALMLYYDNTGDSRAKVLANYIKYGTDEETEIMLLRYGFSMDDFPWLKKCVSEIDEQGIKFNEFIITLTGSQYDSIARYVKE